MIIDEALYADAFPAKKTFLNFCAKNDVFSDICFENKLAMFCLISF